VNDSEWPVPKQELRSGPPVDIGQGEHLDIWTVPEPTPPFSPSEWTREELLASRAAERSQALQSLADEATAALRPGEPALEDMPAYYPVPTNEQTQRLIIGLGGKFRSGKDTVADYLVEKHGFLKLGMSDDSLHQFVLRQNPWVEIRQPFLKFWTRRVFRRYRDVVAAQGYVEAKKNPDLRSLLQLTGTEAGRDVIGEDVWTGVILRKALAATQPVVITGIRFQNEIELIRQLNGWAVWVERPESPSKALDPRSKVSGPRKGRKSVSVAHSASQHASETSLSGEWFDITLENDADLAHLYAQADNMAAELGGL
jgi:hypothetical protein